MILQKPLVHTALFSFISAASGQLFAQNADLKLEEITITASRIEMPLRQVGASVSVMTAEELQQKNYPSLQDALRTLPSVRVSQSGGLGKASSVRIRGEEGHRTLLLVDGINVSDPSAPQTSPRFGHMLNSPWGRVEVLRGPQGMMYGADAGGVISVFSKESDEPVAGDVAAEYGSYNTQRLNGNLRGTANRLSYSLTASDLSSDGFNATVVDPEDSAASVDDDGYDNTTLHGKADYSLTETMSVGLVVRNVDAQNEYDGCTDTNDCVGNVEQQSARASWLYETDKQSHELAYTANNSENVNIVDQARESLNSEGSLEQWQYFGSYQVAPDLSFVFGADHRMDEYTDNLGSNDYQRDQTGVFVEAQTSFGEQFYYTAGVRYDDNEDFGEHLSSRLTAAYLIPVESGEIKLKGSYGTGFRAPSLYEIGYNNGPYAADYVPENLTEESSRGYEIGAEWLLSNNTFVEAVWFDNRIEDEIYFDLATFAGYLQAEGETESRGVELNASMEVLDSLVLRANYTYNDTALSNDTTLIGAEGGDPRARRPKHAANVSVQYTWQDRVDLAAFWRNSRDAVDYSFSEGRVELDDYQVLDLTGAWRFTDQVQAYVRIENALDEDYQEIAGYNTAGRSSYAGIRVSF